MINIFGKCPGCKEGLPFKIKDKRQCKACGKMVRVNEKQAMAVIIPIFILSCFYLSKLEFWLSFIIVLVLALAVSTLIKYEFVPEDEM